MTDSPSTESTLRRILSGDLSEEDRLAFEERILVDPDLFERLQLEETVLLDAWARRELPQGEAGHLEGLLGASVEGRARLTVARGLQGTRERPTRPRWLWFPLAACLMLAVTSGWLSVTVWQQNREWGEPQETASSAWTLTLQTDRGTEGDLPQLVVPPQAPFLYLDIGLAGFSLQDRYRVRFTDSAGTPLYEAAYLPAPAKGDPLVLSLAVPTGTLLPGNVLVVLEGLVEGKWEWLAERWVEVGHGGF